MKFREATDNEMQSLRTNEDSASEILSEARNFPK
jgi:hypothetical protein